MELILDENYNIKPLNNVKFLAVENVEKPGYPIW